MLVLGDNTQCKSGPRGAAAKAAGAAGMLVQSVPYGLGPLGGNPDFPMASIEVRSSARLINAFKANPTNTFTWSTTKKKFSIEGGAMPSGFSSWGPDGELHIKPDISGPGGNMLSTFPVKMNSYAICNVSPAFIVHGCSLPDDDSDHDAYLFP